ncbi:uncharacterized protein LOC18447445 isoform X1 [Amborella trichopoda]|uniref:MHD1 domain-containing protein n=1 Tax=Amborella trichopoda TaxID=13333 RepID=U5D0F7_AMBTC|nr:uncharacterized protein LOC18447445 isoform X1 [Amborella trichopoda]ERN19071.1 hypothetical protein AMTR_s00061p00104430 [Amborella trichopoda]|eukprot:XP_020531262.1 uncharacterized protein LOC18447445 isoform X1 [Amborella trichopoda]
MFTDGLDESALKWINQGVNGDIAEQSPLTKKFSLDSIRDPPISPLQNREYLPQTLPPLKFYSGYLGPLYNSSLDPNNEEESNASISDDNESDFSAGFEETLASSDSDLQENPRVRNCNEDLLVVGPSSEVPLSEPEVKALGVKGTWKGSLRVELPENARRFTDGDLGIREFVRNVTASSVGDNMQDAMDQYSGRDFLKRDLKPKTLSEAGNPSAPPMVDSRTGSQSFEMEATTLPGARVISETKNVYNELHAQDETNLSCDSKECLTDLGAQSHAANEPCPRYIPGEVETQMPCRQPSSMDQPAYHDIGGQSAWQFFVAYDACIRLCLHAWARGCMEAPEFLRDECMALRNAFGLHKFLLQPQHGIPWQGATADSVKECSVKSKKVIGKINVEVKKIRIIPRRKLHATYSQLGAAYMQAGAHYVRHVSALLKSGVSSIKTASSRMGFPVTSQQEVLSCFIQLKNSNEDAQLERGAAICMQPGSGVPHVFFPESQGDSLLLLVQDSKENTQGRATIQVSSLTDNPNDRIRWWPIYHEDQECVGKVQLSISTTSTSGELSSIKCGTVVETLAYDLVLEAAMRSQYFHSRNLRLHGVWQWLLAEFSDYYGISDAYTKLRYLSYVMDVATPTKDCLDLVHELLTPVIKARDENNLTRQEKRILSDCEDQVGRLLAAVFENYKSLDELSPTGLVDMLAPTSDSAAPALAPAVQIYTLLSDILSHEAQMILRNYLQTAARKRCKRHMLETDELMSCNTDGFLMDPLTISSAYLKMKNLCINISNEIQADIKIHNQHILPSFIDLPNIAASVYSTELCNKLERFLEACPPSSPSPHVTELLIATADFERDLSAWSIGSVAGGVDSKNLFHSYIMLWIMDKKNHLLEQCKADKGPLTGITTQHSTSPFVEEMYELIRDTLNEYEVVINRWPHYSLVLENAVADVERAVMKALEKQCCDILAPLKDTIPKKLGMQMQKLTRRHSVALYIVPNQLGTFLNTVKRILELLHCKVESVLRSWASYLPATGDKKAAFGEQLNGVTVMLRTKYKNYLQATVEKLVSNTEATRTTQLKRILEATKETEGEAEIRERMHLLCSQLMDTIRNLHDVFSGRLFVAICRGFWDRMGQRVLSFLESRKENRIRYKGSCYALGILDDTFASQMQRLQGNALQEKDLEPPRSVIQARSILCKDTQNTSDPSSYFYV